MISIGEKVAWIENGKVYTGNVVGRMNDFRGKSSGYWEIRPTISDKQTPAVTLVKHQRHDHISGTCLISLLYNSSIS